MTFHVDWTSQHAEVWKQVLGQFVGKPGIKALEIGVLEGRSTAWFCDNVLTGEGSTTTCIDPFWETFENGWEIKRAGMPRALDIFKENTINHSSKIQLHYKKSVQYFAEVSVAKPVFDFAYIDGSHTLVDAMTDIAWCWAMLKDGGILIVDDYAYKDTINLGGGDVVVPGVKEACDGFALSIAGKFELQHVGWQWIIRKLHG